MLNSYKLAQDYRDTEYILAVRQWVKNIYPQQFAKLDNLFRMAAWTGKRGTRLRDQRPGRKRQADIHDGSPGSAPGRTPVSDRGI